MTEYDPNDKEIQNVMQCWEIRGMYPSIEIFGGMICVVKCDKIYPNSISMMENLYRWKIKKIEVNDLSTEFKIMFEKIYSMNGVKF